MPATLNITHGDTKPTLIQYQTIIGGTGTATTIDITSNTILCRIDTPTPTVIMGTIVDGLKGEVVIGFGALPAGGYLAELMRSDIGGSQTSELFQINVRSPL